MKRISMGLLVAAFVAVCGLNAMAQGQSATPPAPDFGTPPSGQIPILYNDHHVYSKPDVLKQGRVLAALVKNGTVLIPLRSMFEQMGATVSYDAGTKTATVSKPGAEVKVTVGKAEVMINGEARPLDVPPMLYQGNVLVPVRVISEGMGAYVQWVPDQHVVVVRYLPATPPPPPTPAPTPVPTVAPTPTPVPPKPAYKDLYVAGDYIISPKVYNEFSPGGGSTGSWQVRGAFEFNLGSLPMMIAGQYDNFQYTHNCGVAHPTVATAPQCFVTALGGRFAYPLQTTTLTNRDFQAKLGFRIFNPRVYIAAAYIGGATSYGYPHLNAVGVGIEKLPDLDQTLSFYGSVYYFPNYKGTYTNANITPPYPTSVGFGYNLLSYQVGVNWVVFGPVFLDAGYIGQNGANKNNAPISYSINGPYAGLGIKF